MHSFASLNLVCMLVLRPLIQIGTQAERPFLPTTHFRHLTSADGLPVNAIEDIYQDSRGFVWIATADGLAQYDGYTVTTYKHDPVDDNSLSHNHVQAIAEDDNGRLWLATEGGGVNSYDPVTNRFTHYPYVPDTPDGFIGSTVLNAFKDNHNNIWFGSPPPSGIDRINTVAGETAQYSQLEGIDGLAWGGVVDKQGTLWIITDSDLNRYDPQSDTFTSYPVPLRGDHLTDITQTEDGRLWISGMDGLYAFDPQNEKLLRVRKFHAIEAMQLVDNGRLWIGIAYGIGWRPQGQGTPFTLSDSRKSPLDIAKERYARGEINKDEFEQDGEIIGMLSVNAYTGQVFLHHRHGDFIKMNGEDHS